MTDNLFKCLNFDGDFDSARVYVHLFNDLCSFTEFKFRIDIEQLLPEIKIKFPESRILQLTNSISEPDNKGKGLKNEIRSVAILLKDHLILECGYYRSRIFYKDEMDISDTLQMISGFKINSEKTSSFSIIKTAHNETGFDLQEFSVSQNNQSNLISKNYNDDFKSLNKDIIQFLKQDKRSGLVLLHGKQGTGKTSYIRHLINTVNKSYIYLPPNIIKEFSDPGFVSFISDYYGSILIIEDCEDILKSRSSVDKPDSNAITTLLNLTDGLLSDAFNLKIICTFNTDLKNIDKAILRKGRLIVRYEFKELETDKVEKLLKTLKIKDIKPEPMTLADIYGVSANNYGNLLDMNKKVGYRNEY